MESQSKPITDMSLRSIAQVLTFPSILDAIPSSMRTKLTSETQDKLRKTVLTMYHYMVECLDNKEPEASLGKLLEDFVIS